jgi:hypothetical protein
LGVSALDGSEDVVPVTHFLIASHSRVLLWHQMTKKLATNLKVLKMFFQYLDVEGKGSLGVRQLEEPLVSVGLASSRDEVINLVAAADRNGSGALGFVISIYSVPGPPCYACVRISFQV